MGKKGQAKAVETKKKRKTIKELANALLDHETNDKIIKETLENIGLDDSFKSKIMYDIAQIQCDESINAEIRLKASDRLFSYTGELDEDESKEREDIVVTLPAKDIGKAFVDLNRDIDERKHLEYWLQGGRGSIKSSYWSEKATEILENNPKMCAICIRKVGNTLKDSVYSQMLWGIDKLSETYPFIKEHWKPTKSPMEIVNQDTGQIIYFRGADDPTKIKSIKPPKDMYIGVIIFEEFDQMNGMNEVRKIDQSVMRGGNDFIIFRIYNTPPSSLHFVNVEKKIPKENRLIHNSTYLEAPKEWLGQPFFDEAEYLKSVNEKLYRNEYLGDETGVGGNVFENLEIREITDKEIETYDYIYQGLDFGWFPDPLHWTKLCYNPSQRTIYIFDEFRTNKMSNEKVWEHLQEEKGDSPLRVAPRKTFYYWRGGLRHRGQADGGDTAAGQREEQRTEERYAVLRGSVEQRAPEGDRHSHQQRILQI